MKKLFKTLSVIMAFAMLISLVPARTAQAAAEYKLAAAKKTLFVGGCTGTKANGAKTSFKDNYKIKVNGLKSTDKVKYTSKNKAVATVSKTGKVKAVAQGTAKINVKITTKVGKSYTRVFKATVKGNAASVTISGVPEDKTFTVSEDAYTLTAKAVDVNGAKSSDKVVFSIDPEYSKIASITAGGKLTVKSEGDFVITARAYQSATYPGTTAITEAKVTAVEGEKEKEPLKAKQLSASKIELTFGEEVGKLTTSDVKVTKKVAGVDVPEQLREVTVDSTDAKKVVVTVWSSLVAGTEYTITCKEESVVLKGASLEKQDAAKIEVITKKVTVGTENTLEYKVFTAEGIEMSGMDAYVNFEIAPVDGEYNKNTNKIQLYEAKKVQIKAIFSATYFEGVTQKKNEFTQTFEIEGVNPEAAAITGVEYTFGAASASVFDKAGYKQTTSLALNDYDLGRNTNLVFRLTYSDKSVVTNDSTDFDYVSSNPNVVVVDGKTMKPVNAGSASIIVYEKGTQTLVRTFDLTVLAERKPVKVVLSSSKNRLNTVAEGIGEKLLLTATILDNYGEDFPEAMVTLNLVSANGDAALDVSQVSGNYVNGKYVMTVTGNGAATGEGTVAVSATATFGTTTLTSDAIAFTCKKVATSTAIARYEVKVEAADGSNAVDNCIERTKSVADYRLDVTYCGYTADGYQVTSVTAPKVDSASNYSANTTEYFYQVSLGNTVISDTAYVTAGRINTITAKMGAISKLQNGTYTVTLFKVVTDGSKKVTSKTSVGAASFTVTDSQPAVSATRAKKTITNLTEAGLLAERAFTVSYNGEVIMSETVAPAIGLSFSVVTGTNSISVRGVSYRVYLSDGVNYVTVSAAITEAFEKG